MPWKDYLGYYKELCWIVEVATIAWIIAFIHSEQIANPSQIKNVWKDRDSCHMIIPEEDKNILKCNQDKKCLKTPYVIYADTESLLEKVHACDNNPEKFSTTKISKHIACHQKVLWWCCRTWWYKMMIMMMIAMVRNMTSERFMVILQDLMMLMMLTRIIMMVMIVNREILDYKI